MDDTEIRNKLVYIYKILLLIITPLINLLPRFIYQVNITYSSKYNHYQFLMHILFISLLLMLGIILYWDHLYKSAKLLSKCNELLYIIDTNLYNDTPFVYNVMIIHENNTDKLLDKFVIKLEYNFEKKTTKIIFGEDEYFKNVKLFDQKQKAFNYYDLNEMKQNTIDSINLDIITNNEYKFIAVNAKNKVVNNDIAREFAKFVKQYAKNTKTYIYPIDNILNAIEKKNSMTI